MWIFNIFLSFFFCFSISSSPFHQRIYQRFENWLQNWNSGYWHICTACFFSFFLSFNRIQQSSDYWFSCTLLYIISLKPHRLLGRLPRHITLSYRIRHKQKPEYTKMRNERNEQKKKIEKNWNMNDRYIHSQMLVRSNAKLSEWTQTVAKCANRKRSWFCRWPQAKQWEKKNWISEVFRHFVPLPHSPTKKSENLIRFHCLRQNFRPMVVALWATKRKL